MDELLEMAKELDGMDRSVTSWEADFLESVLPRLRGGHALSQRQEEKLREIYERYFESEDAGSEDDVDKDDVA